LPTHISGTVNIVADTTYTDVIANDASFNISAASVFFTGDDLLAHVQIAGDGRVVNQGDLSTTGQRVTLNDTIAFFNAGSVFQDDVLVSGAGTAIDNLFGATWNLFDASIAGPGTFNNQGTLRVVDHFGPSNMTADFLDSGTVQLVGGSELFLEGPRNIIDGAVTGASGLLGVDAGARSNTFLGDGAAFGGDLTFDSGKIWDLASTTVAGHLDVKRGSKLNIAADDTLTAGSASVSGTLSGPGDLTAGGLDINAAKLWNGEDKTTGELFLSGATVSTADLQATSTHFAGNVRSGVGSLYAIAGDDSLGAVTSSQFNDGAPVLIIGQAATVSGSFDGNEKIIDNGVLHAAGALGPIFGSGVIDVADTANAASFGHVGSGLVLDLSTDSHATVDIGPRNFLGSIKDLGTNSLLANGSWDIVGYQANQAGTGGSLSLSNGFATASLNMLGDYAASGFHVAPGPGGTSTPISYVAPTMT